MFTSSCILLLIIVDEFNNIIIVQWVGWEMGWGGMGGQWGGVEVEKHIDMNKLFRVASFESKKHQI